MATRKFITKTMTSSGDNFATYAVVELNDNDIEEILGNREIFQMAGARIRNLHSVSSWTNAVKFFSWLDAKKLLGEKYGDLENKRWIELDETDRDPFESHEPDYVFGARLVIASDGFYFEAVSRYGSTQYEGEKMPYEALLDS